jgi:TetR/AcrR family transcriptional repressor of nem operon
MATAQAILKRGEIIDAAARLVHRKGFNYTSLDEILDAAGAGKGQFYHYFKSKEALGLAIIDRAAAQMQASLLSRIEQGQGIEAIEWMLECLIETAERTHCGGGCPIGNLAAEMSDLHEGFRIKLAGVFEVWRMTIEQVLAAARKRGEIRRDVKIRQLSYFILSTIEGAILLAKVQQRADVMVRSFKELRVYLRRQH